MPPVDDDVELVDVPPVVDVEDAPLVDVEVEPLLDFPPLLVVPVDDVDAPPSGASTESRLTIEPHAEAQAHTIVIAANAT